MIYALLVYHKEAVIAAMSPQEDDALMDDLHRIHFRLHDEGALGPAARLENTQGACTLRDGLLIDGPFAETKEQLLGFYLMQGKTRDEVVAAARDLARVNPSAVYEIRPVRLFLPGADLSVPLA